MWPLLIEEATSNMVSMHYSKQLHLVSQDFEDLASELEGVRANHRQADLEEVAPCTLRNGAMK